MTSAGVFLDGIQLIHAWVVHKVQTQSQELPTHSIIHIHVHFFGLHLHCLNAFYGRRMAV